METGLGDSEILWFWKVTSALSMLVNSECHMWPYTCQSTVTSNVSQLLNRLPFFLLSHAVVYACSVSGSNLFVTMKLP